MRKRNTPSNLPELNLFNWQFEMRKAESEKIRDRVTELRVGDIIQFDQWNRGTVYEGRFVAWGFWDGRDQACPEFMYVEVDGQFKEFNARHNWSVIGHDESYVPPAKEDVTERLIEHLKAVPLLKRIEAYQLFQKRYPHLSYEYAPILRRAWNTAIVAVTSIEELLENRSKWLDSSYKMPVAVKKHLETEVFSLPGEQRVEGLRSIRWAELFGYPIDERTKYQTFGFADRNITYWSPLLENVIRSTNDAKQFTLFAEMWGIDHKGFTAAIPAAVWSGKDTQRIIVPSSDVSASTKRRKAS